MKKTYLILITPVFMLLLSIDVAAQYTGGNASGYTSATSVIQQLNQTIYNDIQLTAITYPADNQTLHINTNYNLAFTFENHGSYPVFPGDSIFFDVYLNTDMLIDSFFILLNDTLKTDSSRNILFPNVLNFSDSISSAQLCITVKGTSFASDSVISNNTNCNSINIIDPTGIQLHEQESMIMYYNPKNKCIVLKNVPDLKAIYIYDIIGNEIPFHLSNINNSELLINLSVKNYKIIFVKVISEKNIITKKLFIF